MGRRLGLLLAVALLVLPTLSPSPAQAHQSVCVGLGLMHTNADFYLPTVGATTSTSFTIQFPVDGLGHCLASHTLSGNLAGHCGNANGNGTAQAGDHSFQVTWAGTQMLFSGGVTGTLTVVQDATTGESCATGAAEFRVMGTLTF